MGEEASVPELLDEQMPSSEPSSITQKKCARATWPCLLLVGLLSFSLLYYLQQPIPASNGTMEPAARSNDVIPVVVFTYNRADFLDKTLLRVTAMIKDELDGDARFPLYASQDGYDPQVMSVLAKYEKELRSVIHHPQNMSLGNYGRLSQHFLSTLTKLFDHYDQVIILEDDLEISRDFFGYISALLPVLRSDPALLCVSAWNDNGRPDLVQDRTALHRTDVFPGYGWITTKRVFETLRPKWPIQYWDEHLRRDEGRQGRQCIRPEVSRVRNFGREGTSGGQFWADYIAVIEPVKEKVDWARLQHSIDIVRTESAYDAYLKAMLETGKKVQFDEIDEHDNANVTLLIPYDATNFQSLAQKFHLLNDPKFGMHRTSYKGVLNFRWKTNHVFLTENGNFG